MDYIEILGLIAATLTTAAFVPQVYKTWQQKSTKDLSLTMYLVMFVGVVLWGIYGFLIDSFPVILANALTALLLFIMLLFSLRYR